jgi:iron-sulfur cluster assembly accessory protein
MEIKTFDPNQELVILTEDAQRHFLGQTEDSGSLGVKLSLTGGGCAGFMYDWKLVKDISEINLADYSKEYSGWTFWLDNLSKQYLAGSTIDLVTGVAGQHIEIKAPLADSACGCGESVTFTI